MRTRSYVNAMLANGERLVPLEALPEPSAAYVFVVAAWAMPLAALVDNLEAYCERRGIGERDRNFWLDAFAIHFGAAEEARVTDVMDSIDTAAACVLVVDREGAIFSRTAAIFELWVATSTAHARRTMSFDSFVTIWTEPFHDGAEEVDDRLQLVDCVHGMSIMSSADDQSISRAALLTSRSLWRPVHQKFFQGEEHIDHGTGSSPPARVPMRDCRRHFAARCSQAAAK